MVFSSDRSTSEVHLKRSAVSFICQWAIIDKRSYLLSFGTETMSQTWDHSAKLYTYPLFDKKLYLASGVNKTYLIRPVTLENKWWEILSQKSSQMAYPFFGEFKSCKPCTSTKIVCQVKIFLTYLVKEWFWWFELDCVCWGRHNQSLLSKSLMIHNTITCSSFLIIIIYIALQVG